jgi:hypothetical protein
MVNDTCDPERQVGRWISGIFRNNGNQMIHRSIENDKNINIVFFYHNTLKINAKEFPQSYYSRHDKYSRKLKFNYYAIKSRDLKTFQFGEVDIPNNKIDFKQTLIEDINTILQNDGINYICIKPWVFSDIGRIFNNEHNLKKWSTIHDNTSYT